MMNKITLLLFSAAIFMAVVSCKKDTEVNKNTFKIAHEEVIATTQSVKIIGSYDYAGTIDGITLELGRQADLKDADAYRTLLDDTDFSIEVKNLRTNTTYYYRYSVEYGGKTPYLTEIKSFKTEEYNLPEVKSKEVVSVGVNRAEVSGEVISDGGGDAVTLRGICWSMSHNPSVGDEYTNAGEGIGLFTCELTNLQPEKTYYARAFAGNSKGVSYGEELTFVTMAAGSLAEVHTIGITGNVMLQATVSGEVTDEGTSAVLERGVCYGKEHYPTTNGLHVSSGSGMGEYSCQLMNLEANVTYYVRAYAINSMGIAYGEEMSFVAMTETTVPVVKTNMVNGITQTSATGHGTVVSDGGATVTRRGLCWSTSHNPTVDGIHADCGNGVGDFSGLMPHLTDLTTYYVRAFAENAIGMAYGEEVSFTVGEHDQTMPPTVTTSEVINISTTTAVGGGNVTNDGGAEVTERGICWSASSDPSIDDNHASNGTGMGSYTCMMTGLAPGTLYYVKAYAVNEYGLSYGNQTEFVTEAALPTIILDEASGTTISYSVTDDGGAEVVEHGVCYGTSHGLTVSGDHVSGGSGTGSFAVELTDLQPGTTYYWCLYAINSAGVFYGDEYSYNTEQEVTVPTVTTNQVTDITQTTAIGGGSVTSDGNATVTERGICWGTSHDPNISGNHVSSGMGMGNFTAQMTELTAETMYYVRAYAINSQGISYGEEIQFVTEANMSVWHTYCENEFSNAVGSNVGTSRWAYEYPVGFLSSYVGFNLTKVSLFSDDMYSAVGGNYTCTIYQGGSLPMEGTAVSTIDVDVPQDQNAWVDFDLTTPVAITGTVALWVVWTANTPISNFPAGCCDGLVDEGTWWNGGLEVGSDWEHSTYGTWTMRQYFTNSSGRGFYTYPANHPAKVDANYKAIRNSHFPSSIDGSTNASRSVKSDRARTMK